MPDYHEFLEQKQVKMQPAAQKCGFRLERVGYKRYVLERVA